MHAARGVVLALALLFVLAACDGGATASAPPSSPVSSSITLSSASPTRPTASAAASPSPSRVAPTSAPGSSPTVATRSTFVPTLSAAALGTVADTTNRLLDQLGPSREVRLAAIVVGVHVPTVAVGPGWAKGSWIALESTAKDPVDRMRARWQALLVVAAAWHLRHLAGLDDVDGGELRPMRPNVDGDGEGAHWWNSLQQAQLAYRDSDFRPSALPVVDPASMRAAVEQQAATVGLRITGVTVTTVQGSAVEIDAVADDPIAYACRFSVGKPVLAPDMGDLEGVLTVIRDPAGNILDLGEWTSGLQGGEGGLGPEYGQFDQHTPEGSARAATLCTGH